MAKKSGGEATRAGFVRHGKLRRSNGWRNAARILVTALVVVVLSGTATVAYAFWGLASNLKTVDLVSAKGEVIGAGSQSIDGELTMLLVGSDTRQGQEYDDGEEGELADVILMLHVSADHKNATVVSFPRDLMVGVPSCPGPNGEPEYYSAMTEQQINSTMMYDGLPCVVRTVEELTGMDIPYAGLVTFDGVVGISNAIGGVQVCLTQPIVDPKTDLDLPAGDVTLKGWDALQFLRTRAGVGDGGDTSRINNQQVFMSALMKQLKSADTLSDPVKVYGLAKAGIENMTLSSNMASPEFLQAMAGTVKDIDLDHINFVQYPSSTHPYDPGRLQPDYESAAVLFDILKSGKAFKVSGVGTGVQVEGKNDPDTEQAAADAEAAGEGEATEASAEGSDSKSKDKKKDEKVDLPDQITGLSGDEVACSQGRTIF